MALCNQLSRRCDSDLKPQWCLLKMLNVIFISSLMPFHCGCGKTGRSQHNTTQHTDWKTQPLDGQPSAHLRAESGVHKVEGLQVLLEPAKVVKGIVQISVCAWSYVTKRSLTEQTRVYLSGIPCYFILLTKTINKFRQGERTNATIAKTKKDTFRAWLNVHEIDPKPIPKSQSVIPKAPNPIQNTHLKQKLPPGLSKSLGGFTAC